MTDFYVGGSTSFIGEAQVGSPSDLPSPSLDDTGWWAGVNRAGVAVFAAAQLLAASQAQAAQNVAWEGGQVEELPITPPVVVSEDYFLPPVFVDGGWQIVYRRVAADELPISPPAVALEDGEYRPPAPWLPNSRVTPSLGQPDELAILWLDEFGYTPPVPPLLGWTRAALWDQDEYPTPAAPTLGIDEDAYQPPNRETPRYTRLTLGAEDEWVASIPVEDEVGPPVQVLRPAGWVASAFWADEEIVPAAAPPVVVSEDYYLAPVFVDGGITLVLLQGGTDDIPGTPPPPLGVDEDAYQPPRPWPVPSPPQVVRDDEVWPTPAVGSIGVDEEGYQPGPPLPTSITVTLFLLDDSVAEAPPLDDGAYSPPAPWPTVARVATLWQPDEYPTPAAPLGVREDHYQPPRPWPVPPPPTVYRDDEVWPTPVSLTLGVDEFGYQPPTPRPAFRVTPVVLGEDEYPTVPPAVALEDDTYQAPTPAPLRWVGVAPWLFEQPDRLPVLEEDAYSPPRPWAVAYAMALVVDDGAVPIQPFWLDEFFYQPPMPWPEPPRFQQWVHGWEVEGSSLTTNYAGAVRWREVRVQQPGLTAQVSQPELAVQVQQPGLIQVLVIPGGDA